MLATTPPHTEVTHCTPAAALSGVGQALLSRTEQVGEKLETSISPALHLWDAPGQHSYLLQFHPSLVASTVLCDTGDIRRGLKYLKIPSQYFTFSVMQKRIGKIHTVSAE